MKLSENFTLAEFVKSDTATRLGIDNRAEPKHIGNMMLLCKNVLEPVRAHFGKTIILTSGYRSKALNAAVGGSNSSQHSLGQGADIEIKGIHNIELCDYIRHNVLFDQLIYEFTSKDDPSAGWCHVSFVEGNNRKEVLRAYKDKNGKTKYEKLS